MNYTILILDSNPNKLVKLGEGVAGEESNLYSNWPNSLNLCMTCII